MFLKFISSFDNLKILMKHYGSSGTTLFYIMQHCCRTMCKTDKLLTASLCRPISTGRPSSSAEWEALGCQDATFHVGTICGAVHPRCCDRPSWNRDNVCHLLTLSCATDVLLTTPTSRQSVSSSARSWKLEVTDLAASLELRFWLWTGPGPSSTDPPPSSLTLQHLLFTYQTIIKELFWPVREKFLVGKVKHQQCHPVISR